MHICTHKDVESCIGLKSCLCMVGIRNVVHSLFEYVVKKIQTVQMGVEKGKFTSYTCSCNGSLPQKNHCYRVTISYLKHSFYIQSCMFTYKFNYLHNYGYSLCSFSIHEFSVFLFFFFFYESVNL